MGKKITTEDFIKKAKEIHGDKYDYSEVIYHTTHDKVKISCPQHGLFSQTPKNHLKTNGCYQCSGKKKLSIGDYIKRANKIHGNKYDYSQAIYNNSHEKIKIICPEHGVFEQRADMHLQGQGCSLCKGGVRLTESEFIMKSNEMHDNKYDYSLVKYKNANTDVEIICPEHGMFKQLPYNHYVGHGCSACKNYQSKGECELLEFIKEIYSGEVQERKKIIIPPYELDVYLPDKKIAFEYCGLYYHSNSFKKNDYHLKKLNLCNKKGIQLITIFEDEWICKNQILKNYVKQLLGLDDKKPIHCEDTKIKEITTSEYSQFLEEYHIEGKVLSDKKYGIFYDNNLISVIGFNEIDDNQGVWELNKFYMSENVQGGLKNMINFFLENNDNIRKLITFVDRRYYNKNNIYSKNGFKFKNITEPDYHYVSGLMRKKEKMKNNNLYWICDCGSLQYEYSLI